VTSSSTVAHMPDQTGKLTQDDYKRSRVDGEFGAADVVCLSARAHIGQSQSIWWQPITLGVNVSIQLGATAFRSNARIESVADIRF